MKHFVCKARTVSSSSRTPFWPGTQPLHRSLSQACTSHQYPSLSGSDDWRHLPAFNVHRDEDLTGPTSGSDLTPIFSLLARNSLLPFKKVKPTPESNGFLLLFYSNELTSSWLTYLTSFFCTSSSAMLIQDLNTSILESAGSRGE